MLWLIQAVKIAVCVVLGGMTISATIICYRKGQYGGCGLGVMLSIALVLALIRVCLF